MNQDAQTFAASPIAPEVAAISRNLANLITQALNLDIAPESIDPEASIYGEGLGLDSIDILEIALIISKEYGIELKADSEENQVIFSSLNALSRFVAAKRTK
ncbi:MAG: phosphopantetheine-binding protein [Pseudomonadota bacterium]